MLQAFIFDMDGVIIDSEPIHFEVDIQTMSYLGHDISKEDLEKYVGTTNPAMWQSIRQEYNLLQTVEEIIEYQSAKKISTLRGLEIEPIEGIKELIINLKEYDIPVAIASSSPRGFIEEVLSKLGMENDFDCVVSGEEVAQGKPAPDVYIEAARQLGVDVKRCLVLEDSRNGIIAAKAAGMRCIGFVNPNSGNQDLSKADYIVEDIREIILEPFMD